MKEAQIEQRESKYEIFYEIQ